MEEELGEVEENKEVIEIYRQIHVQTVADLLLHWAPDSADVDAPVLNIEELDTEILPRRSSVLSTSTSASDDEDAEELPVDKIKPTVPTIFEWQRAREKVFVTGTRPKWRRGTGYIKLRVNLAFRKPLSTSALELIISNSS